MKTRREMQSVTSESTRLIQEGTSNVTRTSTPWHLHDMEQGIIVSDSSGYSIVDCNAGKLDDQEIKANAAFIVKAVNMHEDLVDLLKDLLCHLDPNCEYDGANANGKESEYAKIVIALYQAIAKAEDHLKPGEK